MYVFIFNYKNNHFNLRLRLLASTKPQLPAKPKSLTRTTSSQKKPSKTELDGQKWFIVSSYIEKKVN